MIVHVTFSDGSHHKSPSCDAMREEGKGHSYLPQTSPSTPVVPSSDLKFFPRFADFSDFVDGNQLTLH